MNSNMALAKTVLETLASAGVKDILLCAGARNSPLVVTLEKAKNVRLWNFFEERSAGFFALGKSQSQKRPVAIVTTSGTAVAELLPAAVEATYTGTPLIFVTADRPREYRGTGAPQSIDQVGIFSRYVETCKDIAFADEGLDISDWSMRAPLQINVCFSEPLISGEIPELDFSSSSLRQPMPHLTPTKVKTLEQPLVIAGPMSLEEAQTAVPYLEKLGAPIYAEGLSNLLGFGGLQKLILKSGDQVVRKIFEKGFCQSVFRVGGVPTLRFWRDLEEIFREVPVTSVSDVDFTGLSRPCRHVLGFENMVTIHAQWTQDLRREAFQLDEQRTASLHKLLERYPQSEVSLLHQLAQKLEGDSVYLGNSLPVREWDLVAPLCKPPASVRGNRGANGIDGQISTFMGLAQKEKENWAIIGDLTAMYDLASLWVANQMEDISCRLVVINNNGGMIFKNIFGKKIFLNEHQTEFSHWAKMWNWSYEKWDSVPNSLHLSKQVIIELIPDREQSEKFWAEFQKL